MKKLVVGAVVAASAVVGMAGPSWADHVHSKQVGNGSCVLLARNGGEKYVVLPGTTGLETRRHPLHVRVHLGAPGENFPIGVLGMASDPCLETGDYLND